MRFSLRELASMAIDNQLVVSPAMCVYGCWSHRNSVALSSRLRNAEHEDACE
jgi:hypothetical protein